MYTNGDNSTRLTLIQKLQKTKSDAFWEEFSTIYRSYIYGISRRMNLNHQDCEDNVQAVLLKVWKSLGNFEHGGQTGQFRCWLTSITRNSVLNLIAKRKAEARKTNKAEQQQTNIYLSKIQLPEIEAIAESEWGIHIANLAWDNIKDELSDTLKEVFQMGLDEVPRPEIAEKLGLPLNTVSVYKRRVVARLQKEIKWLDTQFS